MLRLGTQPLGKARCFAHRQLGIDHDVGFSMQPVTDPARAGAIDRNAAGYPISWRGCAILNIVSCAVDCQGAVLATGQRPQASSPARRSDSRRRPGESLPRAGRPVGHRKNVAFAGEVEPAGLHR
jgi:hypothetical protein